MMEEGQERIQAAFPRQLPTPRCHQEEIRPHKLLPGGPEHPARISVRSYATPRVDEACFRLKLRPGHRPPDAWRVKSFKNVTQGRPVEHRAPGEALPEQRIGC